MHRLFLAVMVSCILLLLKTTFGMIRQHRH
jgi:hypothetical protein